MAWAVKRRKNRARIVSAVLFGLGGLRLLAGLLNSVGVYTISWDLSWLAGYLRWATATRPTGRQASACPHCRPPLRRPLIG